MQLTAAQFEHLQRTGQIVQRTPIQMQPVMQENKIVVQKTVTVTSGEPVVPIIQKQKGRMIRPTTDAPTPPKKVKPLEIAPVPALTPINSNSTPVVTTSTVGVYPDLDNFEELLPSTAIARQPEQTITPQPTVVPAVTPTPTSSLAPQATSPTTAVSASHPAPLSDGQLLAVPGEHFGGPQGTFYLCVEDNGTFTAIDNRPLVLENNQLVPMVVEPVLAVPERRDILEAALANSDVFHAEPPRDDGPDFHDLNVNVSVHCRVSETSTTLNQPIMTPVEVPTKAEGEPAVPANLEAGLAVIGVTPPTIPTSLDLPITVTDPRIAPKTTDPLSGGAYVAALLPSPNTDMTYVGAEEAVTATGLGRGAGSTDIGAAPISMPLLTEEEDTVGKSMPILTDDVGERAASSVDSTVGSPSSLETRDTELDEGGWSQRLLTPSSDSSDNSAEIPLQPALQLSTADLNRNG
ncbi:hypothetical protein EVAR_2764_1 [Eumeta japonica]|uniref:Uncharacterized protein n=1 Tax=Eumeta variegata TaxID=151549 RepID=A0A4C1T269_EUMVA|nr:hypothetical protein EVAR_2764_1 [Eumeta japonica]